MIPEPTALRVLDRVKPGLSRASKQSVISAYVGLAVPSSGVLVTGAAENGTREICGKPGCAEAFAWLV